MTYYLIIKYMTTNNLKKYYLRFYEGIEDSDNYVPELNELIHEVEHYNSKYIKINELFFFEWELNEIKEYIYNILLPELYKIHLEWKSKIISELLKNTNYIWIAELINEDEYYYSPNDISVLPVFSSINELFNWHTGNYNTVLSLSNNDRDKLKSVFLRFTQWLDQERNAWLYMLKKLSVKHNILLSEIIEYFSK